MAYVARHPCGCICAAAVDKPERKKETAKFVAGLIRKGLAIERLSCEAVRSSPWSCSRCQPIKAAS
jgi:hypothetical protein